MSNVSYYTADGLKKLREELNQLKDVERPKARKLSLKREIKEIYLKMQNMMQPKRLKGFWK